MWCDSIVEDLTEEQIGNTLKSLTHMVGNVVRSHLDDQNAFNVMANICGSKGSVFNMSQSSAAVGQTFVNGARPDATGGNRILPSAPLPGQKPLSTAEEMRMAGYIRRPYKAGLSMADAFLHNMGGREGLVDTAAKTSRTGYLQRRIVKAMESHHIAHDGSVRDAYQKQYQRWFGHDGLDPMRTLQVTLVGLLLSDAAVRERFVSPLLPEAAAQAELQALLRTRDLVRDAKITNFQTNLSQNTSVYIPFNAAVLMQTAESGGTTPAALAESVRHVDALCQRLEREVPSLHTVAHIREVVCSARLAECRYTADDTKQLCDRMYEMHMAARIQPGEGVGALGDEHRRTGDADDAQHLHHAGSANRGMVGAPPQGDYRRVEEDVDAGDDAAAQAGAGRPQAHRRGASARPSAHAVTKRGEQVGDGVRARPAHHTPRGGPAYGRGTRAVPQLHGRADVPVGHPLRTVQNSGGTRSLEPRAIADLIQEELGDTALVMASRVESELWVIRVYLVDVEPTVDAALKKSMQTGTTRTATKRASQRVSLSRKRRKFVDLSEFAGAHQDAEATLPVPLHRIDPHIGQTSHTPRDVITWMMVRNTQQELLTTVCVCGLQSVVDACVRVADRSVVDQVTGEVRVEEEYVIDVMGSNLVEAAILPAIDMSRIISNDIMAVFESLGIMAASQILFQELRACLGASGSRVDERLIKLVVDVMTANGFCMPISRHGMNRLRENGVLSKICFEETLEQLFEASACGLYDGLMGVSENTMVGRQARLGSNLSRMVILDGDGERVECTGGVVTTHAGAGPDTRILTSVVTESGSDDFEDFDTPLASEPDVDRLLTTRNVYAGVVQSATPMGAEKAEVGLYQQHFFHRPALPHACGGTQESGAPPLPVVPEEDESMPPFRPSSPLLVQDLFASGEDNAGDQPFRPSSPAF